MPILISLKTGEEVIVSTDRLDSALSTGLFKVAPDQDIAVVDDFGNIKDVKGEDFEASVGPDSGLRLQTLQERIKIREEARLQEEFGGVGSQILTGVEGALSGATFGLSDVVERGLGFDAAKRAQVNPTARSVGEVAGFVAPIIATAGGALGAKVVGAGVKKGILSTAGKALAKTPVGAVTGFAEKQIAKQLGKEGGESLLSKSLARGVVSIPEGAVFQAGENLKQLALSDKELTAENLVAVLTDNTLQTSLLSGGIGAAVPFAGALLKVGGRGAKAFGNKVGSLNPTTLTKSEVKAVAKEFTETVDDFSLTLAKNTDDIEGFKSIIIGDAAALTRFENTVGPKLGKAQATLEELEPLLSPTELIRIGTPEALEVAERIIRKRTPRILLETPQAFAAAANAIPRLKLKNLEQLADTAETLIRAKAAGIDALDELRKFSRAEGITPLPPPLRLSAKTEQANAAVKTIRDNLDNLEKETGRSLTGLEKLGSFSTGIDIVAGSENNPFRAIPYLGTINNFLAAKGFLGGGKSLLAGAKLQRLQKPFGAATEDAITGALKKTTGTITGRIARFIEGVEKQAAKPAVSAAVVPLAILAGNNFSISDNNTVPKNTTTQKEYAKRAQEIRASVSNEQGLRAELQKKLFFLNEGIAKQVVSTEVRKLKFLQSKLVPESSNTTLFSPAVSSVSTRDLSKFANYVRAVQDPLSLLKLLNEGRLNLETVEAVSEVYPRLFAEIQAEILEKLHEIKNKLSYREKTQLAILLRLPTTFSSSAAFGRAIEATVYPGEGAAEGASTSSSTTAVKPTVTGLSKLSADKSISTGLAGAIERTK